ncbi:hypothetical protein DXG01_015489 [Tephrocybe rancida]|nr:hypothetical protein DXG01_015489 [Tephrocybe rancida]
MLLKQATLLFLWTYFTFSQGLATHEKEALDGTGGLSPTVVRSNKVLILGGGVAGIIAARTLHEQGIDDFLILEARAELGGRLQSTSFGTGNTTVELGANWIQGTQTGDGPINPILTLARKHGLKDQPSNFYESMSKQTLLFWARSILIGSTETFDKTGEVDFLDVFNASVDAFERLTEYSGERLSKNWIDLTAESTYNLLGYDPHNDAHALASEYFNFDWEYAQKPDQSSAIATSRNSNFTYNVEGGGFSDDNLLSIDHRGFKMFIQKEAATFLQAKQLRLKTVVKSIHWSSSGVIAVLEDGSSFSADYAICTFSLGVLKNDDVEFVPRLPAFKAEAIATMTMGTYTKIFLQFPRKFWFNTEFALYADPERGRYPVWQSLDHEGFMPGSGIIFATVTGDFSQRIEAMSDAEVKAECLRVLQSMYPNITIPAPMDFKFARWFSDPLFRGSYSNWPPSFVSQHHDNLRANVERLYFAGEATSQDYYGYLHGAYFEGVDIAKIVTKCIRGKGCVELQSYGEIKNTVPY